MLLVEKGLNSNTRATEEKEDKKKKVLRGEEGWIYRARDEMLADVILTDGLNDHGVHLVWTEFEFVARETGMRENRHRSIIT